jgi:hypothetical protein
MMSRATQVAGAVVLALALVAITMTTLQVRPGAMEQVELLQHLQQLDEFNIAGSMQTGEPAPQGIPLSFQLPVPLPAPSPPAPTVITVGPRPKKAPVCERCERQMRKIKVSCRRADTLLFGRERRSAATGIGFSLGRRFMMELCRIVSCGHMCWLSQLG